MTYPSFGRIIPLKNDIGSCQLNLYLLPGFFLRGAPWKKDWEKIPIFVFFFTPHFPGDFLWKQAASQASGCLRLGSKLFLSFRENNPVFFPQTETREVRSFWASWEEMELESEWQADHAGYHGDEKMPRDACNHGDGRLLVERSSCSLTRSWSGWERERENFCRIQGGSGGETMKHFESGRGDLKGHWRLSSFLRLRENGCPPPSDCEVPIFGPTTPVTVITAQNHVHTHLNVQAQERPL